MKKLKIPLIILAFLFQGFLLFKISYESGYTKGVRSTIVQPIYPKYTDTLDVACIRIHKYTAHYGHRHFSYYTEDTLIIK